MIVKTCSLLSDKYCVDIYNCQNLQLVLTSIVLTFMIVKTCSLLSDKYLCFPIMIDNTCSLLSDKYCVSQFDVSSV